MHQLTGAVAELMVYLILFLLYIVCRPTIESNNVRENIKRKFLVDMPEDFYQLWEFCKSIHSSEPEGRRSIAFTRGL